MDCISNINVTCTFLNKRLIFFEKNSTNLWDWVYGKITPVGFLFCFVEVYLFKCFVPLRFRDVLHGRVEFLRDGQRFSDRTAWSLSDMHLQILDEPDVVTKDSTVMFIRRWHPSTATLDRVEEIYFPNNCSFSQFRDLLSKLSHVPAEYIEVMRPSDTGSFPFESPKLKLLEEIQFYDCSELSDQPVSGPPLNYSTDGYLIYFRDSRQIAKMLTEEERKEMQIKDNVRFRRTSYGWRKESVEDLHGNF